MASTFSPRFQAVICEGDRLARRLDAPLSVIHGDRESEEKAQRFREALASIHRSEETPILWAEDPSAAPAESILTTCRQGGVDILLAGALERDNDHRFFLGGVARTLLQYAPCDLLLVTRPSEQETHFHHVVIEVTLANPLLHAIQKSLHVAQRIGAEKVTFISVITPFDEVVAGSCSSRPHDEDWLIELLDPLTGFDGDVETQIIRSTTGFGVCDFVQEVGADLLIVIAQSELAERRLPAHMDWLLQVIPTNVLLLAAQPSEREVVAAG